MPPPQLYRQLLVLLRQWISPQDQRHLQGFSEAVSAILQSESGCPSHWLPYLSHRDCNARSHLERLHYFLQNPAINATTYYVPLLQEFLRPWAGGKMTLVQVAHLKKLGLLKAIHPNRLTPDYLIELVWKQLHRDPLKPSLKLDLEALPRISKYLLRLTKHAAQPFFEMKYALRSNSDRRTSHFNQHLVRGRQEISSHFFRQVRTRLDEIISDRTMQISKNRQDFD